MHNPKQRLWIALSDLFLDTDVSLFYDNILTVMADLDFTDEQVSDIFLNEVAPALAFNLYDIAGEWAAFPDEWVIESIAKNKPGQIAKWLDKKELEKYVRGHWDALLERRKERESAAPDDTKDGV